MDILQTLKSVPIFETLNKSALASIADIALKKKLDKKAHLFYEGDAGYSVYVLLKGRLQLYKTTSDGRIIVIKVINPFDIIGEVILSGHDVYPANCVALEESLLLMIPRHQFSCLLEKAVFREEFISSLLKKIKDLTNQIKYLATNDVEERLYGFFKENYPDQKEINLNLTKKEVASIIYTTPETLSRTINNLTKQKKLSWQGKRVVLHDSFRSKS